MENKRIENLSFSPATYLLPKEKWPEHPSYHINYWYPNGYYKRESEFIKQDDWYYYPDNKSVRIHKDCFKNPQSCMAIASFDYDEHENFYEIRFISDRPLSLTDKEKKIFWELLIYGNNQLNKKFDE